MQVSSYSLFHYTTKFENVFSIISNGFRFSHNIDEMPLRGLEGDIFTNLGVVRSEWHSDIICFCDIPLSLSKDHRKEYGNYVIGMSKEWASRNSVTPVRYVHRDSPDYVNRYPDWILAMKHEHASHGGDLLSMVRELCDPRPTDEEIAQLPISIRRSLVGVNDLFKSLLDPAFESFHLIKMHKGSWTDRTTQERTERQFYDEREWRAVGEQGKYLSFTLTNITRIILNTDTERESLFSAIQGAHTSLSREEERTIYAKITTWDEAQRDA